LICLALPLYFIRFAFLGVPTNLMEVILYLAFVAWLIYRWRKEKFSPTSNHNNKINWHLPWAVWAWLAIGLIAALVNPDRLSGLGFWRAYFFDGALVYLIIANEYELAKKIVPRALIITGGIVGAISLASFWGWHLATDGRWLGWYGFEAHASPNYLSLFLVPIFAMSAIAIWAWRGRWRYLAILSSLIMLVALIGSQSRGAIIGIIGGLVVAILWWRYRDKTHQFRWLQLSAIVLVALAVATFFFAKPDFMATPESGRVATSNNIRWYVWQTSIEIVGQRPLLGVGLGNYQNYFTQRTKDRVNYPEFIAPLALTAHNLYLHILTTMGVVGLIVFMWLIWSAIKAVSPQSRLPATLMILAGFVSILFYGFVDTPFFKNDLAILWWLLIGILLCYPATSARKQEEFFPQ